MSQAERTGPVVVTLHGEVRAFKDTETIARDEWEAMTPTQRAIALDSMADESMNNAGGYGYTITDEGDAAMVGDLPRPVDADEVMRLVVEYGAECGINSPLTSRAVELINQIMAAVTR